MTRTFRLFCGVALFVSVLLIAGCAPQQQAMHNDAANAAALENIQAGPFDTGKMWTFDFPPMDYFAKTYAFNPTKEWFEQARLSALRLPGCTAAFVSEDGLVMTNHHCARGPLDQVNREGEKLAEVGFYAPTIAEERKVPNLYIDQLLLIEDVTAEVQTAFDAGTTDSAKVANRTAKMTEIQKRYVAKFKETSKDSMVFNVVAFYNGGRYSVYGYKRFTDIRIVYAPEELAAFFGGDWDNFTYPRYDFDVSFFRVYDGDKPIKTSNFFKFSKDGAKEGEAVFVIGNPGSTNRLHTVSQLETYRDVQHPYIIDFLKSRHHALTAYVEKHPEDKLKFQTQIFGIGNSLKFYTGVLEGLRDPVMMAKKKDFEKKFRNAVVSDRKLSAKYGDPWKQIAAYESEIRTLMPEANAMSGRRRSAYIAMASDLVDYANAMKMPEADRPAPYKGDRIQMTKTRMMPRGFNAEVEKTNLVDQLAYMKSVFGTSNAAFNTLLGKQTPEQAAAELAATTILGNKEKMDALTAKPEDVFTSTDPFIVFVRTTAPRTTDLMAKMTDLREKQAPLVQNLGNAMYEVYGTQIPPDATFTLRIADGVVKGYEYNGTIAPPFTTFYGLYDRYYSFGKAEPYKVGDRWVNPPATLNLSTPMNFASTNDIIGGNSGSSVINRNLEVVGLVFDGNIESLPGQFIFDDTKNRTVSVHSSGILEGLEQIYKADRIAKELRAGKIAP